MTIDDEQLARRLEAVGPLDAGSFRAHLGTTFHVDLGGERIPLRLADVTAERTGAFISFAALFHGPPERVLAEGTYALDHDAMGPLALFIVPVIGSNAERTIYEACFSRPNPTSAVP